MYELNFSDTYKPKVAFVILATTDVRKKAKCNICSQRGTNATIKQQHNLLNQYVIDKYN